MQKQSMICATYGESNVNDLACQKWLAKFHARDLLLRLFHG